MEAVGGCDFISDVAAYRESDLAAEDASYIYPVGLNGFELVCANPGDSADVTYYYDQVYDTSEWVFRKFDSLGNACSDISDIATYAVVDVNGTDVTTISYTVTDGDPQTDEDGLVDGLVHDPSGPGIPAPESTSSNNTARRRSSRIAQVTPTEPTLPSPTTTTCTPLLTANIRLGADNNPDEVNKLITFLNDHEGESLTLDGSYDHDDFEALQRFQTKHKRAVLDIWGLDHPTGYVYKTTRLTINQLACNQTYECPTFTEYNDYTQDLNLNTPEVATTKTVLTGLGFYHGPIDTTWGSDMHQSLITFQETFADTMLTPWGLTNGTGYKYKTTNKFLNFLVGCETPPVELEGVGVFDL
jgi:hypothetical protein